MTRKEAKAEANRIGVKYRITRDGEIHFHSIMPNSNVQGWWFVGYVK